MKVWHMSGAGNDFMVLDARGKTLDFEALAKEYSNDTGTAENGGQYLMYMDGNTITEYADAVKKMKSTL